MSWNRASTVVASMFAIVLVNLSAGTAWSQEALAEEALEEGPSYYDHRGWYVKAGFAAGFLNGRDGQVDVDPGVGFAVAVGVRHNDWIGGEFNMSFIYDSETKDFDKVDELTLDSKKSVEEYELTYDLHFYPLGLIEVSQVPDWVQPYTITGLGFSEVKVGSRKEGRFMLRFGAGVDVMLTEMWGVYVDGGYSLLVSPRASRDNRDLAEENQRLKKSTVLDGRGNLGFGVLARF